MYLIPKNVSEKYQFIPGFGWVAFFVTLGFTALGVLVFFLLGLITPSPFRFLVVILFAAIGIAVSYEDPRTGASILGVLDDLKDYNKKPTTYEYEFGKGRVNNAVIQREEE